MSDWQFAAIFLALVGIACFCDRLPKGTNKVWGGGYMIASMVCAAVAMTR